MPPKLYWNKMCPFVQRAWITAIEKNYPVELVEVPLGGLTPEWYKKINPRETVPTLEVNGKLIFESSLIAHFIDDSVEPKGSLFPGDALTKNQIRFFVEQAGEFVGSAYGYLRHPNDDGKNELIKNLKNLNALAEQQSAGPFFLGSVFSIADISIVPFLDRFRYTLRAFREFNIFDHAPRLHALLTSAFLRPSVFQTSQSEQFYVNAYKSYAGFDAPKRVYKLYSNPKCPFAERSRIAAALKKVDHEVIDIDLENIPEWYGKINPRLTVPTLVTPEGDFVHESLPICSYFEEQFPGAGIALQPTDPVLQYDGRFFADTAGNFRSAMFAVFRSKGSNGSRDELETVAQELENLLVKQSAGPFLFGAEPSVYDLSINTFLLRFKASLPFIQGAAGFFDKFPRLLALTNATYKLPSVQPEAFYDDLIKARFSS